MGSVRIGSLQRTRRWLEVVGQIERGASVPEVAAATIHAAAKGLANAGNDKGVIETTDLLIHLPPTARDESFSDNLYQLGITVPSSPGTARDESFSDNLYQLGITVPSSPGLMDLVCGFTEAIDARLANNVGRTDLGEMAQMAGAETLAGQVGSRTRGLFDATPDSVRLAVRELSTPAGTGALFRAFFGRLIYKTLDYFLSRTLAEHVGQGRRFVSLGRLSAFSKAMEDHCNESAAVVEEFASDWVSRERYRQKTVSRDSVCDLAHGSVSKILQVLKQEAGPHAQ